MQGTKRSEIARKLSGRRQAVGLIVAMIVLGGAVAAGSAMGKKDSTIDADQAGATLDTHHAHTEWAFSAEESYENGATYAFEIKDFSFGVENPTTIGSATGGAGAGKIKFNEFTIKKTTDKASPALFRNCASGAHYKTVVLEMRQVSDKNSSVFKVLQRFTFGTVFTTKIDWSGPGDEGPEESITFVYGTLTVAYNGQTSGDSSAFGWDQIQNKAYTGDL